MKINLQRAIASLTGALDLVGIDEVHHGKRIALMAAAIAQEMHWPKLRCEEMLYAGMIHDCGVSRLKEDRALTATLEWEGAEEHCLRGEKFLLACPPLARFSSIVRWHHTRWETLLAHDINPDVRLEANLIFLADRADVLLAPYFVGSALNNEILWEHAAIVERIASLGGTLFSPELVDAFCRAADRESFWLAMDPAYIEAEVEEHFLDRAHPVELDAAEVLDLAGLFAHTIDSKSSYLLEHSTRVAKIARHLAESSGIRDEHLDQIEIAGLLHDLGKLRVPQEIIDKPGPLNPEERAFITRHSFDTGYLLKRVFPDLPIADWAAMHHENLLGTGYPFRRQAKAIPREARLIAVADIFQALSQERPYRDHMGKDEVMSRIEDLCDQGHIDSDIVGLLRTNLDHCYTLAIE